MLFSVDLIILVCYTVFNKVEGGVNMRNIYVNGKELSCDVMRNLGLCGDCSICLVEGSIEYFWFDATVC